MMATVPHVTSGSGLRKFRPMDFCSAECTKNPIPMAVCHAPTSHCVPHREHPKTIQNLSHTLTNVQTSNIHVGKVLSKRFHGIYACDSYLKPQFYINYTSRPKI